MMSVLEYAQDVNKTVSEILNLCKKLNIDKDSYKISVKKVDNGILCNIYEYVGKYRFFECYIKALFTPGKIQIPGRWYVVQNSEERNLTVDNTHMTDITGVLLDFANVWFIFLRILYHLFTDFAQFQPS